MDEIKAICDEYKTTLVEDAAESLGAIYKGQKAVLSETMVSSHLMGIKS